MDVPALEIAVYQNLRETAQSEGFFDQSPESAWASLASALTYGLMTAKDLVKSGLPAEVTKMDRRIYEYRSRLVKGMHGLASPVGFQILVVRLMTAGEGEFEKSRRDAEALARSMTIYVLYALFCGPGGPPYPSIEESGIRSDLSWLFGGRADGQAGEAKSKDAKFAPPKPTLPAAVDPGSTSADAHSDAPVEFVYATVPTAWAVVLPPGEPEFIVLPRQVAQEQAELWSALEAKTWGDLLERDPQVYGEACGLAGHTTFEDYAKHLSVGRPMPGALEEARKQYEESGEAPPADAPFELDHIPAFADGDWPPSYRMLMYESLPKGLAEQCGGEVYDTNFNGVFVEFPASAADKVIKALEGHGYRCTLEPALITSLVNRR